MRFLVKTQAENIMQRVSWDAQCYSYALPSNGATRLSSVTCHEEKRVVTCAQDTRHTAVLGCDRMIVEQTHTRRTLRMPFTPGVCNGVIWRWRVSLENQTSLIISYMIFRFFNKESHYGELAREFCSTFTNCADLVFWLCMCVHACVCVCVCVRAGVHVHVCTSCFSLFLLFLTHA
jgi:succinate dehydrogenase hydrophobic anchor subunit